MLSLLKHLHKTPPRRLIRYIIRERRLLIKTWLYTRTPKTFPPHHPPLLQYSLKTAPSLFVELPPSIYTNIHLYVYKRRYSRYKRGVLRCTICESISRNYYSTFVIISQSLTIFYSTSPPPSLAILNKYCTIYICMRLYFQYF